MKRIFAVFLMIFLVSCGKVSDKVHNEIFIDNGEKIIKVNVEIADDDEERANGLMFRQNLNESDGMLFIFDSEEFLTFWMKNTLIPLDMLFIDEKLEIVDIKRAVPCKEEPCALYTSSKPAQYVLEVNGNFTTKNDIMKGDKIRINQ